MNQQKVPMDSNSFPIERLRRSDHSSKRPSCLFFSNFSIKRPFMAIRIKSSFTFCFPVALSESFSASSAWSSSYGFRFEFHFSSCRSEHTLPFRNNQIVWYNQLTLSTGQEPFRFIRAEPFCPARASATFKIVGMKELSIKLSFAKAQSQCINAYKLKLSGAPERKSR